MIEYLKLLYYILKHKTIFLYRTSHSLGDNLLLTNLLPLLRAKYLNHKIVVETAWKDLFLNNPYVDWVTDKHIKKTKKHIKPKYKIDPQTTDSIYRQMSAYVGEPVDTIPQLFLSEEEKKWAKRIYPDKFIVICPVGVGGYFANRKEWGLHNFQSLRDTLHNFEFVQIGVKSDPVLNNVIDARGLPIRKSASIVHNALLFIGLEGGLMHLAKAVGTKAIIIYGGAVRPETSHYEDQIIFYNPVHCSPCFYSYKKHDDCDTMICMKQISPEMILEKIQEHFLDKSELKECR